MKSNTEMHREKRRFTENFFNDGICLTLKLGHWGRWCACSGLSEACLGLSEACLGFSEGCLDLSEACLCLSEGCLDFSEACLCLSEACLCLSEACLDLSEACLGFTDACLVLWEVGSYTEMHRERRRFAEKKNSSVIKKTPRLGGVLVLGV